MLIAKEFLKYLKYLVTGFGLFLFLYAILSNPQWGNPIPVTGEQQIDDGKNASLPALHSFTDTLINGDVSVVRGVYIPGMLAMRVVQQPQGEGTFVSAMGGVVTQFMPASSTGVTGLIAHNFSAGKKFFNLRNGHVVNIVYGDGSVQRYVINQTFRYQALDPESPNSDFIDLETNQHLTSAQVYNLHYSAENQVTFQTCITQGDNLTWGRLFVIATVQNTN